MRNKLTLTLGILAALMPLSLSLVGCGGGGGVSASTEVTGTVIDSAKNDAAVAGATVTIGGVTAKTAADGTFDIKNAPVGTKTAIVTASGQAAQTIGFLPKVQPLPATNVTLTLNIGQIGGRVLYNGAPIAGVSVLEEGTGLTATTDTDGTFLLTDIPLTGSGSGDTVLFVKATASATKTVTVVAGLNDLGDITIVDSTTGTNPPSLPAPTVTGKITLSDQTGSTSLSGTTVTLSRSGLQASQTITDANGAFSFYAPVDGNYTITALRSSYQTQTGSVFSVTDPRTPVTVNLTLIPNP